MTTSTVESRGGTMRRVVGGIRLSSLTEETTSPERQKALIEKWADDHDSKIVGWAVDLDVSAGIPPWDRPELGDWLNNRAADFDVLAFAKLDRAVRSLRDFVDLDQWATAHAVDLVVLDPPLDLTTSSGRLMAQILAIFAEFERGMIAKRTQEGYAEILRQGRWPGGRVPYGYRKTKIPGRNGWYLTIDETQAEVIRGVANRIIGGESTLSQAKRLNAEKVPTARGGKTWAHTSLYELLRSVALLGQRTKDGEVIRGDDGLPIQYAEPILSRETWERLQETLKGNSHNRTGNRNDAAPLLRVAYCACCKRPVHRRGVAKKNAKGEMVPYFYYRCASANDTTVETCPDRPFRAGELENIVFGEVLSVIGEMEVERRIYVPGEDHTEALEMAQSAYYDLTEQLTVTKSATGRKRITEQLSALDERIAELEGLPNRPASWRYEGTGQTYRELWETLTDAERGAMLRDAGVQVYVFRLTDGTPVAGVVLPPELAERAKVWAAGRD